jgi:D-beta-D-heptose 7-phosphate kinase/D-beta-D-heptose 1-phosphate adenosyltransferase
MRGGATKKDPGTRSNRGVFAPGANSADRYIPDYLRLSEVAGACKTVGLKTVLTMGTFDLIHVGHFLYLEKAKALGDVLIVGVDSDAKVRARKGPDRPVVSESERVEMLTHVRHVDAVTLKHAGRPKWELIKLLRPDVLVATEDTYTPEQLKALEEYCADVVVLHRQATTSTTAKLRRLNIGLAKKMKVVVSEAIESAFAQLSEEG